MTLLRRGSGGDGEPPPRSDEERESARAERAARRAQREGRPVPDGVAPAAVPPPAESPPAADSPPPPPPPAAVEPAESVEAVEQAEPAESAWFEPAGATPRAPVAAAADVYPPASPDRLARLPSTDGDTPLESVMPSTAPPDDEPATGTRSARRPSGGAAARGPRRRRRGRRVILLLVLLGVVGALAWFANALWQPFHGAGHGRVVVVIPPNSSSKKIGDILASKGAVSSGFFFALRARLSGKSGKMRPGRYVLRKDMPYSAAITALSTPPRVAKVVDLTIPEGLSIREAAPRVKAAGLRGSYLTDTARSAELRPRFYGAPKATHSLEGFLFPATYQLRTGASVKTLIHKQIVAFRSALRHVNMSYARSKHLTLYDVLTIASMVERESASPADRKKIAAVIYNRLHNHIPLGIDATLRFELHDWNRPLTVSQLRTDTPYNTRIHLGLPPTPIGSPGLAAMQAAAHPAHVSYLFYVANADGCGGTVFSSTDAKFERDAARYRAAVAANHGHVPTCKHK